VEVKGEVEEEEVGRLRLLEVLDSLSTLREELRRVKIEQAGPATWRMVSGEGEIEVKVTCRTPQACKRVEKLLSLVRVLLP
jgi:hypothetical protein